MKVDVLRKTEQPERLVCQAARGDYFEGYVGDTEYAELMKNVDYEHGDVHDALANNPEYDRQGYDVDEVNGGDGLEGFSHSHPAVLDAKTRSFIEKQLSRGHYGPWEHPSITFSVKGVSRVTMAQITRHRHMTFDIQSMRYADFSEQEIVTPKSLTEGTLSREKGVTDVDSQEELEQLYEMYVEDAVEFYERMVRNGVPKEDARFILPLGTTVNMTFSGNARTFLHLLDMRKKANAQWEIRELSEALLDELFDWMSYTFNYYADHGPNKLSP